MTANNGKMEYFSRPIMMTIGLASVAGGKFFVDMWLIVAKYFVNCEPLNWIIID